MTGKKFSIFLYIPNFSLHDGFSAVARRDYYMKSKVLSESYIKKWYSVHDVEKLLNFYLSDFPNVILNKTIFAYEHNKNKGKVQRNIHKRELEAITVLKENNIDNDVVIPINWGSLLFAVIYFKNSRNPEERRFFYIDPFDKNIDSDFDAFIQENYKLIPRKEVMQKSFLVSNWYNCGPYIVECVRLLAKGIYDIQKIGKIKISDELRREHLVVLRMDVKKIRNSYSDILTKVATDYDCPFDQNETQSYCKEINQSSNEIKIEIKGQKYTFNKNNTKGDGWCTFYAAGLEDPVSCIEDLQKATAQSFVCNVLAEEILRNYMSAQEMIGVPSQQQKRYIEKFSIGEQYKSNIDVLYEKWREAKDDSEGNEPYHALMNYLKKKEVIISYLNHLLKEKYASITVVKLYMNHVLKQPVGVITKCDSNYRIDEEDIKDKDIHEIKFLLYDPSESMESAHYTKLELKQDSLSYSFNK